MRAVVRDVGRVQRLRHARQLSTNDAGTKCVGEHLARVGEDRAGRDHHGPRHRVVRGCSLRPVAARVRLARLVRWSARHEKNRTKARLSIDKVVLIELQRLNRLERF